VEKVLAGDLNKINDLRALLFLQRRLGGSPAVIAPLHGFCVQVKAAAGEIPRIGS
jgi:hypothetical protein